MINFKLSAKDSTILYIAIRTVKFLCLKGVKNARFIPGKN